MQAIASLLHLRTVQLLGECHAWVCMFCTNHMPCTSGRLADGVGQYEIGAHESIGQAMLRLLLRPAEARPDLEVRLAAADTLAALLSKASDYASGGRCSLCAP